MPGTFSKSSRPTRPGAYFNFEAVQQPSVPPAVGSIVALPFTSSWGPLKKAVSVGSFDQWVAIYGRDTTTDGYKAAKQVFQGEGITGRGGAGTVIAFRMGGAAATKATYTMQNGTPAAALRIDAVYEGSRGNNLRVTMQDHAADSTKDDLIILDGTTVLETYVYSDTGLAALAAQINGSSSWVRATVLIDGVRLAPIASAPLSGGNDGSTLLAADWTALMAALEVVRFGILAPYNLLDLSILASLKAWVQTKNSTGKRFMLVVGGALDEAVSDAASRSLTLNDPNIINVGVGSVSDAGLPDVNNSNAPTTLSTAQLVPRIAGILAARGQTMSLTFARLAGVSIINGPTDAQISTAFDGGVMVLSRDSNLDAPVRIEKALTTWLNTNADANRPYLIFRNPKFVRTMHSIESVITEWAESNVIGQLPVSDKTRDTILAEMVAMLKSRENAGIIQPNWTVKIDTDPPPTVTDEFVALVYGIAFGRSIEQVFGTVRIT